MDAAYEQGPGRGVIASRMTGGGFGGSTISLVRAEAVDAFVDGLQHAFRNRFQRDACIFPVQAVNGASLWEG